MMFNWFKTETHNEVLERLETPSISRQVYSGGKNDKPNEHCSWQQLEPLSIMGWVENDSHFRDRILKITKEES